MLLKWWHSLNREKSIHFICLLSVPAYSLPHWPSIAFTTGLVVIIGLMILAIVSMCFVPDLLWQIYVAPMLVPLLNRTYAWAGPAWHSLAIINLGFCFCWTILSLVPPRRKSLWAVRFNLLHCIRHGSFCLLYGPNCFLCAHMCGFWGMGAIP